MALAKVTSVSGTVAAGGGFINPSPSFTVNAGEMLVVIEQATDINQTYNTSLSALATTMTGVTFTTGATITGLTLTRYGIIRVSYWFNNTGSAKTGTVTSSGNTDLLGGDAAWIDCITISGAQSSIGSTSVKGHAVTAGNTSPTVTLSPFTSGDWAVGCLLFGTSGPVNTLLGTGNTAFGASIYSTNATISTTMTGPDWIAAAIEIMAPAAAGNGAMMMMMGMGS